MSEKILIQYLHEIDYSETDGNVIGATTNLTLRTVAAVAAGTTIYVRKFGTPYLITDVTDIEDPLDADMTFTVYALDGTELGHRTGGGAYVDGAELAVAQGCYLTVTATGACTVLAGITITTDVDAGGREFTCPAEVLGAAGSLRLYLSDTGSTYYDSGYMYGGARHTPVEGIERKPYFTITAALTRLAALGGLFKIVHVLDSATYDEDITLSVASTILQAALGQTPTITRGVGARVTREVAHNGNNLDTVYVGQLTGDDPNPGTYQSPYKTITAAYAGRGARTYLNIMDSETYTEAATITFAAAFTVEPLYGKMPIINNNLAAASASFLFTHASGSCYGMIFIGSSSQYGIQTSILNWAGTIRDNTCSYLAGGIFINGWSLGCLISNNYCFSCDAGIYIAHGAASTGSITNNILYANGGAWYNAGIYLYLTSNVFNDTLTIANNVIYGNTNGIYIYFSGASPTFNGTIENNTITKNINGINVFRNGGTWSGTTRDLICYGNTIKDFYIEAGAPTFSRTNYTGVGYLTGWSASDGVLSPTTDPKFCTVLSFPYKLGISSDSGAYRTDTSTDDMGAQLRILEINNDTITINGFNIDGQEQYNNGIFIVDNVHHISGIIKWCSIYDFQGIAIDLYDTADILQDIFNCKIYNNGNGIKLTYGGNEVEYCLIYNNTIYGIYSDYTAQEFIHDVFFGNETGLYLAANSAGLTIKDSIFTGNSLYGINSVVAVIPTYCCINDSYSALVDVSDASNIIGDPQIVSIASGAEDFHIKTTWLDYFFNSVCYLAASDGYDIGAYVPITRATANDDWKKYEFAFNPQVEWANIPKGVTQYVDAKGNIDNYAVAHRRGFTFKFDAPQVSSEILRQKMEYFTTLIQKSENTLVDENCKFRVHMQPTTLLENGTAVISSTAKTLTVSGQTWIENQFKGFHVGIKYTSGILTGTIVAAARTMQVVPDPSWTNDQWIGYYFYYNGYYYYILDNDHDTLTLSDPQATLANAAVISWSIEKYFKILSNSATVLAVRDDDSELVAGTYYYYIDFIVCKLTDVAFGYSQPRFLYTREYSKTGFQIQFEEVD